jgi:small subunit ribosomal protein S10
MASASPQPKIRIRIQGFDHRILDRAVLKIVETAERTGALVAGPIPLPTKIERITILRSTFKHKKSREQIERRTHRRLLDITGFSDRTVEELQRLELTAGVGIEIRMA